jgi:hypothetical protein
MELFIYFIIAIFALIVVVKEIIPVLSKIQLPEIPRKNVGISSQGQKGEEKKYPFKKKRYLMTQTEYKFYEVLHEIIKDKFFIMPQVALSRIIEVQDGLAKHGSDSWYANFSRINKKTIDFVVFDKIHLSPMLVIELDDYTHNYFSRQKRDEFLDNALKSAGLNILHVKPRYNYDKIWLEKAILEKVKV